MATKINIIEIEDPQLEFGGVGEFFDPKEGLKQGGPFDLRFGNARRASINIGFIGHEESIQKALNWLTRCKDEIVTKMPNTVQYPSYPGFKQVFRTDINFNTKWNYVISDESFKNAFSKKNDIDIFKSVLGLFEAGIETLNNLDSFRPDTVICCLQDEVVDKCWSVQNTKINKKDREKVKNMSTQLSLFDDNQFEPIEEQQEDILHRDFRRALKAIAMKYSLPIQIGRDTLFLDLNNNQDAAIRAWNSSVALYYKSGGMPWRLRPDAIETCYVGLSFHHLYTTHEKHLVRSCIAQAFSSDGEGFAIRGANVQWDDNQGKDVHLTEKQAILVGEKIIDEYKRRTGSTPLRVVLHKTTYFNDEEKAGLHYALNNIPVVELVNLALTDFRLVRFGDYPPKRGTLCIVNDQAAYLFTSGFMPSIKTYPGPHIPVPIQIKAEDGADITRIASDVIALSRMNWNTASITGGHPVTLSFSRMVGGIMAEYGDKEPPSSFRYYL
ncbi:MAG: hypothetical protein GC192_05855 [Bacteroidetes bacterium]|nr:hypothetical protein [Bacteroidota bacterium]